MAKKLVAVIDLGSVTARLKIFEISSKGRPKEIEVVRKIIAVGNHSYRSGIIDAHQLNEICSCLHAFDIKCKEYRVSRVFCVGTAALRDAGNRDVIIDQIRTRTGFRVEVLDNSIERFYQNMAVKEVMPELSQIVREGTMILDIGASSLQATVYDKSEFIFSQNMVLGSLRIYELLSDLQSRTTHYEDVLEEFISQDLEDYHAVEPKGIIYKSLVAFGGELGFIKLLALKEADGSCVLTKTEFLRVYEYLLKTRPTDLSLNNRIPSNIAPLLLPAALIIRNMLEYTGVDKIYLPHVSLSDGIVYNYCSQFAGYELAVSAEDDIIKAARNIAKRYRTSKKHIEFVENAALEIFDASVKIGGMKERDRLLLRVSAILHECGKFIHAAAHNEAAFGLLKNSEIIGLTKDEINTIAMVVKLYPRENPYEDYDYQQLPANRKILVSKLTAMLRIADSMDSSHKQKIRNMTITLQPERLHISCEVTADMSFEEWSFEHRSGLFEEVIGIKPQIRFRRKL